MEKGKKEVIEEAATSTGPKGKWTKVDKLTNSAAHASFNLSNGREGRLNRNEWMTKGMDNQQPPRTTTTTKTATTTREHN